jgi:large subunit ribosomal protein L18
MIVTVNIKKRRALHIRRKRRVRKKISGTTERPRLAVFRSARHVYAQVIDDTKGITIASVSSFEKDGKNKRANVEVCAELGKTIAERCKAKEISKIVFDKSGNRYHGRIKAFADGARAAGLDF